MSQLFIRDLFCVSQGSYAYTIGKKMGSFAGATVKSEASQTTGKNPSGQLFYGVGPNTQYSVIMPAESMRITVVLK